MNSVRLHRPALTRLASRTIPKQALIRLPFTSFQNHQICIIAGRQFSQSTSFRMPDTLTRQEITSQTDPSVAKQYDNETPKDQQVKEFYDLVDSKKIGLLSTFRNGVGPVARSMAVAKRVGPDFLFLANLHSNKFNDIKENPVVQITFQDFKNQDWVSVAGKVVTSSNDDPRIKELWSTATKAWFGDLGDGKHDGSADDPRMAQIEVKTNYISYWLHQVGALGFIKEVGLAAATGKVADTGVSREIKEADVEKARSAA
ncbi:uncharacterized protein BDZ99DRAFT_458984 [Mytilinidion resinicola]|uniref:General stress protein FMN-binding split barrel domain-containing protein n=1 Tax=Mytilinidion resinicola TaxID=574789 RepID=A0A6A6Z459_9PEZI|nr:uncharacterized protein BDZ99DRAFT_458984 [Mytilinidion resinicola]KAF2815037.1 hypothetical protein BDZ99DRAFT_458984 [Mytilinidion resinicola]